MPLDGSHYQHEVLTCRNCGRPVEIDVWLIVDGRARPSLLAESLEGELRRLPCECGHLGRVDAPLLLLLPDVDPPLLFSPAEDTSLEEDQEQLSTLVSILWESLEDEWNDEWIAKGVPFCVRDALADMVQNPLPLVELGIPVSTDTADPSSEAQEPATAAREAHAALDREGDSYIARYRESGDARWRDRAIEAWTTALASGQEGAHPAALAATLHKCGDTLRQRHESSGALTDAEMAITLLRRGLEVCPKLSVRAFELRHALGLAYVGLYDHSGERELLDSAVELQQTAITFARRTGRYPAYLSALGSVLLQRFEVSGDTADLEAAVAHHRTAASVAPRGDPITGPIYGNLALALDLYYDHVGTEEVLGETRRALAQGCAAFLPEQDMAPEARNMRSLLLYRRYEIGGSAADLEDSIRFVRQAIAASPTSSPALPGYLSNLGVRLAARYDRFGSEKDLDEAIDACRRAVGLASGTSPYLPRFLSNLGLVYADAYRRRGDLLMLRNALQLWQRAFALSPQGSQQQLGHLENLSIGYLELYERNGEAPWLRAALDASRQVVAETSENSPSLASRLNNLATAVKQAYLADPRPQLLEAAIRTWRRAAELSPANSPALADRLNNLGAGLSSRYEETGDEADFAEAAACFRRARRKWRRGTSAWAGVTLNLAILYRERHDRLGQSADLRQARDAYRATCQTDLEAEPSVALQASRSWGRWAIGRGRWREAASALAYGVEASDRLMRMQPLRADKEVWLGEAKAIHQNASYAHLKIGGAIDAVTVLERGRAQLLAEALELRSADLKQLSELGRGDLLDRYLAAAQRLARLTGSTTTLSQHPGDTEPVIGGQ